MKIYQWIPHDTVSRGRLYYSWKSQMKEYVRSRKTEEDMTVDKYIHIFDVWNGLTALDCKDYYYYYYYYYHY